LGQRSMMNRFKLQYGASWRLITEPALRFSALRT
jgi:hypothetical protein